MQRLTKHTPSNDCSEKKGRQITIGLFETMIAQRLWLMKKSQKEAIKKCINKTKANWFMQSADLVKKERNRRGYHALLITCTSF